jgi:hypothetical protein
MQRYLILTLLLIVAALAGGCAKFRQDYFTDPTARYTPNDPCTRSWVRHWQTGHAGLFYNCDGEERKRCSPYICWKHADPPWPCETIRKNVPRDLYRIRQRIRDGSCYYQCDQDQCPVVVARPAIDTANAPEHPGQDTETVARQEFVTGAGEPSQNDPIRR